MMMIVGLAKRTLAALLVLLPLLPAILGAVYKVGDSAGWTTIGNIDYKTWSATKTFQIGDTISKFHSNSSISCSIFFNINQS